MRSGHPQSAVDRVLERTQVVPASIDRTFAFFADPWRYRRWEHTHRLTPVAEGTEIYDHVRYRLPYEPVASLVARWTVVRWLDAIFDYRAERIEELLRSQ